MPQFEERVAPRPPEDTEKGHGRVVAKVAFKDAATIKRMAREWSIVRPIAAARLNEELVEKLDNLKKHNNDEWVDKNVAGILSDAISNGLTATLFHHIDTSPRMGEWSKDREPSLDFIVDLRHDFTSSWALLKRIDDKEKSIKAQLTDEQKIRFDVALTQSYQRLYQSQQPHVLMRAFFDVAQGVPVEEFEFVTNTLSPRDQQKRDLKFQAE